MNCSSFSRAIAYVLSVCQVAFLSLSIVSSPVYAQVLDTEPPRVGFDTVGEAFKGDSQVFTVTATDDQVIESIVFRYRLSSDTDYQRGDMTRIGDTDLYSFTIPAESISDSVEVIQYYIEAKDEAGNRTLQGFSFDPVERILLERSADVLVASDQTDTASSSFLGSLSTTQKVVFGVVGVVVLGALISSAGGGGGSNVETVPVVIEVEPLDAL